MTFLLTPPKQSEMAEWTVNRARYSGFVERYNSSRFACHHSSICASTPLDRQDGQAYLYLFTYKTGSGSFIGLDRCLELIGFFDGCVGLIGGR